MARLSGLFSIILAFLVFANGSAEVVTYRVTFVPCVPGQTCPEGNPTFFSQTFALNNVLSPSLTLNVGDQLVFNLATNVSIHPLTICKNSPVPSYCQGATVSDTLNTPITQAGTTTSVTFATPGTYYYGCLYHPGMGGTINVIQRTTLDSTRRTTTATTTQRPTTRTTTATTTQRPTTRTATATTTQRPTTRTATATTTQRPTTRATTATTTQRPTTRTTTATTTQRPTTRTTTATTTQRPTTRTTSRLTTRAG